MMRRLLSAFACATLAACGTSAGSEAPPDGLFDGHRPVRLERFASARDFQRYLASLPEEPELRLYDMAAPPPPAMEAAPDVVAPREAEPGAANPEITNNQTVGVDEGGIVKQIGRFLVVLQDGRLFTADLGAGPGAPLRLADRADVYRSRKKAASWYDEMLVSGNRILVTAYDYGSMSSEISVFRMDAAGRLEREGRFLLSSADYYSTENYATRLVGDRLVFYAPVPIARQRDAERFEWPRIRRARGDGEADAGDALIGPTDVYAPPGEVEWPVMHTLSVCPLREEVECRTTAFIGPPMRDLYVSPTDAFLWIGAPDGLPWSIEYANKRRRCGQDEVVSEAREEAGLVYRLPLDGEGEVGAVAVDGTPANQFSFDSRNGRFRALLAKQDAGCRAFGAPVPLALLDVPLSAFQTDIRRLAPAAYVGLPQIEGGELENRFVGEWLVYGGRTGWSGDPRQDGAAAPASSLFAIPLARPSQPVRLAIPHSAVRIERAGNDAIVTGYRDADGLSLSYVSLGGGPRIAASSLLRGRFESEARSHAFNVWMRPDGSGVMGLPTTLRADRSVRGWSDSESSELSFVAIAADKRMSHAGELALRRREGASGYLCEVSCVDWYGNSRPIFTGGRIFALMGTELVEGGLERGRIAELGRLDLTGAPARPRAAP